ncbi:hypothetical protein [Kineococcus sp. SYSU DK004]|uniref:hypothetical protein n=1 Tax=Kineococcus sp. SYSU DK004 TaxID=3383125 RepID=UPI003D7DD53F
MGTEALDELIRDVHLSEGDISRLLGLRSRTAISTWREEDDVPHGEEDRLRRWRAHFLRRWPDATPAERRAALVDLDAPGPTLLEQLSPADPDADLPVGPPGTCGTRAVVPPDQD